MRGKKLVAAGMLLVLLVGAAFVWTERVRLRSWYSLRGLSRADESDRDLWIERMAALGEPAVDGLLEQLGGEDDRACQNAAAALDHLACRWGCGDPRTVDLVGREARLFSRMSPAAQAAALHGMAGWFHDGPPAAGLVPACSRLLSDSASVAQPEVLRAALELSAVLLRQPRNSEALRPARDLARAGLQSECPDNRLLAVRLSLHPGMDLLENIVALLRDPAVGVRRAAVLAVGPAEQVVRDEGLLPCLHDPDPEVRKLTEAALKGRGLSPEHLEMGRLLTHPDHRMRVKVLDHLREPTDLDPGLWLRRLSHDPKDSVRAAALRMMSHWKLIDLTDRIDQMARSDPSPTVAQLAQYYLTRKRKSYCSER